MFRFEAMAAASVPITNPSSDEPQQKTCIENRYPQPRSWREEQLAMRRNVRNRRHLLRAPAFCPCYEQCRQQLAVSESNRPTEQQENHGETTFVVLNAKAGALLGQDNATESLAALFKDRGIEATLVPPGRGTLTDRLRQARDNGATRMVVAGGDGTIACAAGLLAGSDIALGIIPCGTMNLLASDLQLPAGDFADAISHLAAEDTRSIDVGEVNGNLFLCASMLGTPAKLSRHRELARKRGNGLFAWTGFASAALRALRRNANQRLTLHCNGQTLRIRSPSITITVNKLNDEGGRLFSRSCLDGKTLAIYIVRPSSPLRHVALLLRTVLTGTFKAPEVQVILTTEARFDTGNTALHVLVDGELRLVDPPLRYTIHHRALRVIAPNQPAEVQRD